MCLVNCKWIWLQSSLLLMFIFTDIVFLIEMVLSRIKKTPLLMNLTVKKKSQSAFYTGPNNCTCNFHPCV